MRNPEFQFEFQSEFRPEFQDWGLIDYKTALNKQLALVEKVAEKKSQNANHHANHPGFLIFCTHPHIVTLGRQTQPTDVFAWAGESVEISRGGRATYHGPSQLVIYPILNLKKARAGRGPQEIRGYLRALELTIIETLKEYSVNAKAESADTGVWVGSKKIASLGIAVKKWVTYHGAAINLDNDPLAFQGLNPCGFKSSTMICLETLLGKKINREEFGAKLLKNMNGIL